VYTPTIGEAIQHYSHEYRRPRGVYLSIDHPDLVEESLRSSGLSPDEVDIVVATDAEAILGIGDWGVGGIEISIGKLAVYTAAAGIDPNRTLPVMLDVGTNRQSLIEDPFYLGDRHERRHGPEYERFMELFVAAVAKTFPQALLHWEDFGAANARYLLEKYGDAIATFNDDAQGTGAINLAAVLAAVRASGSALADHKIVIYGAGTAGIGIADELVAEMVTLGASVEEARARIWALDSKGLVTDSSTRLDEGKARYARPADEVSTWERSTAGTTAAPNLLDVVRNVRPTILIGTSTTPGAFTEEVVRTMAAATARPVIVPLSNPTALAEATPVDIVSWTDGAALVATGSPFDPVHHDGVTHTIGQANNALIFPGLGLGVVAARAKRVTASMLSAAAHAVADLVDASVPGASLLPPVGELRSTSLAVAVAVVKAAREAGVASTPAEGEDDASLTRRVASLMWEPVYRPVRPA
ncbi:MAG TPA: NAD-dependent malic enzyme, partial [Acidimicrobiales bacterium]|nr:NAD-dependent malic enzyme [Acidimicrobiales bacterium]